MLKNKQQEEYDVYDRLKARKIRGESCKLCGEKNIPLVKTRCCEQWSCCDKSVLSFGSEFCFEDHENYSACHFHYNNSHKGCWQECKECRKTLGKEEFESQLDERQGMPIGFFKSFLK